MSKLPPIVIDTREQAPLAFEGLLTVRGSLRTGDYSLLGFERVVTVERKSHQDAWGCAGRDRKRFERCLQRMAKLDRALIVIEPSLSEFLDTPEGVTRLTPASAAGAYLSWIAQYGIPTVWCGNRAFAERVVFRFLQSWWRHRGSLWVKQAIAENASAAGLDGSKLSDRPDRSAPSVSGGLHVPVLNNCSVVDAITASSIASARALSSEGE